jgi:Flp pilus assembly pilin Flp
MINKSIFKSIISDHSGVTLLELTVSVALFALTIIIATGIFQTVVSSQRTAIISEDLQENIRYDFEKMGKDIRTAQADTMHTNCLPAGYNVYYSPNPSELKFINYRGQCVDYFASSTQIYVAYPNSSDNILKNGLPLSPREVKITKLVFKVTDSATKVQAAVVVRMRLSVYLHGAPAEVMDMETSLSSRSYQ